MLIATSYFREGTMPEHEAEHQTITQNNNEIQRFERELADRIKNYSTTDNVEPLYGKEPTPVQESYLHDKIDSLRSANDTLLSRTPYETQEQLNTAIDKTREGLGNKLTLILATTAFTGLAYGAHIAAKRRREEKLNETV